MEIAVASSSPLGQYLAELEEDGDESMAHLLSAHHPSHARKKSTRRAGYAANYWRWLQLVQSLHHRIEMIALQQLLPDLCAFHSTLREELQETISDAAMYEALSNVPNNYWRRHVTIIEILSGIKILPINNWQIIGVLVAGLGISIIYLDINHGTLLQLLKWILLPIVILLCGVLSSIHILLTLYARCSKRLLYSLNKLQTTLQSFNQISSDCLTTIKRAELTSQGFQLGIGTFLPPLARFEAIADEKKRIRKTQLHCVHLRKKLRVVNENILSQALNLLNENTKTIERNRQDEINDRVPSLLLTTLIKQRNRSLLVLENAVLTILKRTLTFTYLPDHCNLFSDLSSLQQSLEQISTNLSGWTSDLNVWNTTKDPVTLFTSEMTLESSKEQTFHHQQILANLTDPKLKCVAMQLQSIRSMSETLTALSIAAQYELLSSNFDMKSFGKSRDLMQSLILQLQEEWRKFDNEVNVQKCNEKTQDIVQHNETLYNTEMISEAASLSTLPSQDPNCTIVFTGTSTGDDNFDLKSLSKQQRTEMTAIPTFHFIHELQNVLAHRVAHAQPGLMKQVDQDTSSSLSRQDSSLVNISVPLPPVKGEFVLPALPLNRRKRPTFTTTSFNDESLANVSQVLQHDNQHSSAFTNAFQLELQALLQRNQASNDT
ncbi:uncharacterized protein PHALS_02757 [Plasmopara halstedii]|uniref:Vezatin n=1 Tax=Plasmopara halstedii TaxID=4781 RepID=A0A0P1AVW0_PLAHL|nr:uncharacterized protein PHALS_02757 [Plasmopara halstedii]CEG46353.1 hypothetical protein PHALS_02757 [Plasmopara halstedii]|eukprot:XP_024582722.1 hypothetical protein PHALS_02757 [Plasmopara halstedii]